MTKMLAVLLSSCACFLIFCASETKTRSPNRPAPRWQYTVKEVKIIKNRDTAMSKPGYHWNFDTTKSDNDAQLIYEPLTPFGPLVRCGYQVRKPCNLLFQLIDCKDSTIFSVKDSGHNIGTYNVSPTYINNLAYLNCSTYMTRLTIFDSNGIVLSKEDRKKRLIR